MTKVPKASEAMVATMVRTIFAQPDPESTWAQHRRVVDHLADIGVVDAADHLDEAAAEALTFTPVSVSELAEAAVTSIWLYVEPDVFRGAGAPQCGVLG